MWLIAWVSVPLQVVLASAGPPVASWSERTDRSETRDGTALPRVRMRTRCARTERDASLSFLHCTDLRNRVPSDDEAPHPAPRPGCCGRDGGQARRRPDER